MVVPPNLHPKMVMFSRKNPLVGKPTILKETPHHVGGSDPRPWVGWSSTPKALMLCDELLEVGMKVSEATYHAALEKLGERQTFEVRQRFGGEQDDKNFWGNWE